MLQPVRIEGARIPQPDPLADFGRLEEGTQITYTAPDGEVWGLHYPTVEESEVQRVVMAPGGMDGASVSPDFTDEESVNQFGARQASFRLPPFEVTTGVTITSDVQPLAFQERDWRRSWSFFKDGRMTVVGRDGQNRWTPARLVAMPDVDRELMGERYFETEVKWRSMKGIWFGPIREYLGTVTIYPPGDVWPSLRLKWDGSATSVTFPTGQTVHLPQIAGERFINLDYGYSGQVTYPDGKPDSAAWSALQGLVGGITIEPYEAASFTLGDGLALEVTPRYFSPWG